MSEQAPSSQSVRSVRSDRSDDLTRGKPLRPSGGYHRLRSFQVATLIYDAAVSFCGRFLDRRSRTVDQMVQAAGSGRQNIAEGGRASATSSQTELRLVNVARSSLDELLLDYEDFLRQRGLGPWAKDSPEAQAVRAVGRLQLSDRSDQADLYATWLPHPDPMIVANAVICLIHQANYLLDRQIAGLERQFVQEGGHSERLAAARIEERGKQRRSEEGREQPSPACPTCSGAMVQRTARKAASYGERFWGCCAYPRCLGTRPLDRAFEQRESDRSVRSDRSDLSDGE